MNTHAESQSLIRRILVALQPSTECASLVQAALELARQSRSELSGLYIEENSLLKISRLPVTREISNSALQSRSIASGHIERSMRAQASLLQREIERQARRAQLPHSFRVLSERWRDEIDADWHNQLLILGLPEAYGIQYQSLLNAIKEMILYRRGPVLLIPGKMRIGMQLVVEYENSPEGLRALQAAQEFARQYGRRVLLLVGHDTDLHGLPAFEPDLVQAAILEKGQSIERIISRSNQLLVKCVSSDGEILGRILMALRRSRYPLLLV